LTCRAYPLVGGGVKDAAVVGLDEVPGARESRGRIVEPTVRRLQPITG
jgi:hypothetical protein